MSETSQVSGMVGQVVLEVRVGELQLERLLLPSSSLVVPCEGSRYRLRQVDHHYSDEALNGTRCANLIVLSVEFTHTVVRFCVDDEIKSTLHQKIVLRCDYEI